MDVSLLREQSWKAILSRQPGVQRRIATIHLHTVAMRAGDPTTAPVRETLPPAGSAVMALMQRSPLPAQVKKNTQKVLAAIAKSQLSLRTNHLFSSSRVKGAESGSPRKH
jgi:hypothetical protein